MMGHGYFGNTIHRPYPGVMPPRKAVMKTNFEVQGCVEGEHGKSYLVQVEPKVTSWIKEQSKDLWHEHLTESKYKVLDTFEIHEKLYSMMALRWSS